MTGDTNDHETQPAWERAAARRLDAERAAHPVPAVAGNPTRQVLARLMAVGLGIAVLGGILFFTQWPTPDDSWSADPGDTDGDIRWALFGLAIASIGGLLCSLAAIGYGVSLGVRDAEEQRGR